VIVYVMQRFTVLFEDRQARRVERLAVQYGLTEREVVRQLVELGLETVEEGNRGRRRDGELGEPL
jgi:hypothetical protein